MSPTLREKYPPKGSLSISAVKDFIDCPLRWWGSRIARWPRLPASAPLAGTALHAAIELHHLPFGEDDTEPDPELELVKRWQEIKPVIAAEQVLGKTVLVDLARSLQALELYRTKFPPNRLDSAEWYFEHEIPGLSVPFCGFIDLVTEDKIIRDHKSGSSKWDQAKADKDLQATAYVYAMWREIGEILPFEFVILYTGFQQPVSVRTIPTTRTMAQLEAFEELLRTIYGQMQVGHLQQRCRAGWCAWTEECTRFMTQQRLATGETEAKPQKAREPKPEPVVTLGAKKPSLFEGRRVLDVLGEKDGD